MAVPKKKPSKPQTKTRFRTGYVNTTKKKLLDRIHVVVCDHCGESKISHHICPSCNHYKGKDFTTQKTNLGKEKTTIEI